MAKKKRTVSYISGSTFFTLLTGAKRDIDSNGEEIPNYKILLELSKIFKNDSNDYGYSGNSAVQNASKYRAGTAKAQQFMGFYDPKSLSKFDERIERNRLAVLNKINAFIDEYLNVNTRNPWLVYALFDVVFNDKCVDDDWILFTSTDGKEVTRKDLKNCDSVTIPEVLLGVWLYTLHHKDDQDKIKEAYNDWTETKRDGKKYVVQELFAWKSPLDIKEYVPTDDAEETEEEGEEEISLVEDDDEKPADDFRYFITPDSVVAPDLAEFDPEDIVLLKNGMPKAHKASPYGLYMANIQKKHESVYNFLYKGERKLSSFYVCNDLTLKSGGSFSVREWEKCTYIVDADIEKLPIPACKYIVLTAEGGMGKSMATHHLTVSAVTHYDTFKRIPIFITARLFNRFSGSFIDLVLSEFKRHNPAFEMKDLVRLLGGGYALLIIDGLDELSPDRIGTFFDELELFMDQYQDAYIIVSTRRHVNSRVLGKFTTYELMPFRYEQAIEFVEKVDDKALREGVTQEFIEDLKNKRSGLNWDEQHEFLGNPLLLSIMLLTYTENHVISSKRFLFYEDAYNALASKHDATKGLTRDFKCGLDPRDFQLLFGEFCATAYDRDVYDFKKDEMYDILKEVISANGYHISVDAVISDITEKLCLMFKEGEEYHFIHKTFMEYFAAYFFSKQDAMYYEPIYNIFRMYDETRHDDETLNMLYGMAPQQVERHIVYPYLKEILERRFTYVGEPPKDAYNEFVNWIYPCLYFVDGDCGDENYYEDTNSAIYNFIRLTYGIDIPDNIEVPERMDSSLALFEYYYVPEYWQDPDEQGEIQLMRKDDIDPAFFDMYPTESVAGVLYEVSLTDICTKSDRYRSLLEYIFSEDFVIYKEYKEVEDLYYRLKEKYEGKKKDPEERRSFTSRFHH